MNTISTKSRNKKTNTKTNGAARQQASAALDVDQSPDISERVWRISAAAILILGAFLRLFNLSLVPLHHDEGVNGNFLVTLVREGKYFYDPQNYHGPTLYYFSAVIPWIVRFFGGKAAGDNFGLTTFNIRLVPALFGIATILLALMLRKRLGAIGALSAAGLIAISPGAVYLSRYFIHESLYVFFTFAIVIAALKYFDTGRALYLILGSISAALMVATKETWIINAPVLLIALTRRAMLRRPPAPAVADLAGIAASVDWIEAADNYVEVHIGDRVHLLRMTMHAAEQKLRSKGFVRIHRRYLVNERRIAAVSGTNGDRWVRVAGRELPVGSRFAASLPSRLDRAGPTATT